MSLHVFFWFFGARLVDSTWRMETFNLKDGNFVVQNPPKSRGPRSFSGFYKLRGWIFSDRRPCPPLNFGTAVARASGSLSRGVTKMDPEFFDRKLTSKWVKNHRFLKFKRRSLSKNSITNVEDGCAKPSIICWFRSFFWGSGWGSPPFRTRSKKSVTMWSTHLPQSNLYWSPCSDHERLDRYIINWTPAERCPLRSYNQCIMIFGISSDPISFF